MTRTITCDVCGVVRDIVNADDYFVLQIPHRNIEEEIDEPLIVDICTMKCLNTVVTSLNTPDEPKTTPDPEPAKRNGRLQPRSEVHYEGEVTVR